MPHLHAGQAWIQLTATTSCPRCQVGGTGGALPSQSTDCVPGAESGQGLKNLGCLPLGSQGHGYLGSCMGAINKYEKSA